MKVSEIDSLKIGDTVATSNAYDATVFRVTEVDAAAHSVQITAPHGWPSPRWVDISLLQRATARQKSDPHNHQHFA